MGRPVLGAREIRRFTAAENVVNAYKNRAMSDNWATWAKQNPEEAELLGYAVKALNREDNGD